MPFKLRDWQNLIARLDAARRNLAEFRGTPADHRESSRYLLDQAILGIHAVAEYAINILLELANLAPERHHRTGDRARDLQAVGRLKNDYKPILDQLQNYRLAAQYKSYGQKPSVHYNAANVATCLAQIDALVAETNDALQKKGWTK